MSRTIVVKPLRDGVDQRGSWQVTKYSRQLSTHTKKSAAKRQARQKASENDTIEIRRTDGSVQDRYRYRGSSSEATAGHKWDVSKTESGIDSLTSLFD